MSKIMITGGARSGKSRFAQELALKLGEPVLFVATALPLDEEMVERIREHQKVRPPTWTTLELNRHVGRNISQKTGTARVVLIDCITLLIGNVFHEHNCPEDRHIDTGVIEKECHAEINELIDCMRGESTSFIIVTNEVGEGLVPMKKMSRLYRDMLGIANQSLAREVDTAYLMVAGIPVMIKPPPEAKLP